MKIQGLCEVLARDPRRELLSKVLPREVYLGIRAADT